MKLLIPLLLLFMGAYGVYSLAVDIRTQLCVAACHTDTECERCDN